MTIVPRGARYGVKVWDRGRYRWLGTRDTLQEARQLEQEHDRGDIELVSGWARVWLSDYARPAAATRQVYRQAVKRIVSELGSRRLDRVDRVTARRLALGWPRNVSAVARTMWADAVRDGVCSENPWTNMRLGQSRGRKDIQTLSEDQLLDLAGVAETVHGDYGLDAAAVVLALGYVGLRPGELCALRWGDVDLAGQEMWVRRSLDATGQEKLPKNGRERLVAVAPAAAVALQRVPRVTTDDYVFHGFRGRRLNKAALFYVWRPVRAAWEQAGNRGFPVYELRHAAATIALELGLDAATVAVQLGHTDGGALILERYGHPSEDRARDRLKMAYGANVRPARDVRSGS